MNYLKAPFSHFQAHYRAAIALNNAGVALVKRHHYQEAIAVFNDAVTVMRNLLRRFDECQSLHSHTNVDEKVQRSAKLIASRFGSNDAFQSRKEAAQYYSVVTDTGCKSSAPLQAALDQGEAGEGKMEESPQFILIYMEPDFDSENSPDLEFESAIILNNYGAAFRGLALLTANPLQREYFRRGGLNVFLLTHSTLSNVCNRPEQRISSQRMLTVAAFVLRNVLFSGLENEMEEHRIDEFENQLEAVQTLLLDFAALDEFFEHDYTAAAA